VAIRFPVPDSAESALEDGGRGERVTLQEAAARLGVGITTARRWVRNGRLKAIREETPQGHIWRVLLPAVAPEAAPSRPAAPESADSTTDSTTDAGAPREVGRLEAHVTDLRLTVADLREQLARKDEELVARRREVQELHVLLGRAQLPKPVEVAATPESDADSASDSGGTPPGTPQSDSGRTPADSGRTPAESGADFGPGRPWWKRLLFG
jgi:excisionase family DNA binding protein